MKLRITLFLLSILIVLSACSGDKSEEEEIDTIVFADAGWESIVVHNHIAQTIIEEGMGYKTDTITGSTATTFQGLIEEDIHVYMEVWTENIEPAYKDAIDAGEIVELATNFDDNEQGLYVPTYVIEGDEERGIEPMAPDLKTVEDLKDYPDLFEDPEQPGRGRIINASSSGSSQESISMKFETYGLDETMNDFIPGSVPALTADLVDKYEKGEPWVGYYWSPTWVTAKYDLTLLEEPEYDEEIWLETRGTAFPSNNITVAAHKDFPKKAPEVAEFLEQYETSNELTEAALTYLEENDASTEEAGEWWLKEYEEVWTEWVSEEIAEKVKESLK